MAREWLRDPFMLFSMQIAPQKFPGILKIGRFGVH